MTDDSLVPEIRDEIVRSSIASIRKIWRSISIRYNGSLTTLESLWQELDKGKKRRSQRCKPSANKRHHDKDNDDGDAGGSNGKAYKNQHDSGRNGAATSRTSSSKPLPKKHPIGMGASGKVNSRYSRISTPPLTVILSLLRRMTRIACPNR